MSFDAFIQMDGIGGEALDDKHKGWIEITGYNFGSHQSTTATASSTGGASSGRTTLTDLTFTKLLDSASCRLMEACCAGDHLKEVRLTLNRAGGEKLKYLWIVPTLRVVTHPETLRVSWHQRCTSTNPVCSAKMPRTRIPPIHPLST